MPLVRQWRRLGFVGQLVTLLSVSLVLIGALLIAVVALGTAHGASGQAIGAAQKAKDAAQQAKDAAGQAKSTADCVNNILALRAAVNATDAAAYKAFIDGVAVLAAQPAGETAADQRRSFDVFKALVVQVKTTLDQDEAFKSSHPLGKC